jgi:hypothetical protein
MYTQEEEEERKTEKRREKFIYMFLYKECLR